MNKKKIIISVVATIVLLALIGAGIWIYMATREAPIEGAKEITIEVTFLDQTTKEHVIHTDAEYLGDALLAEGLISGSQGEYGLFIDTVDGVLADSSKGEWWTFTKDGEWVTTGADLTPIADGDHYEFSVYVG